MSSIVPAADVCDAEGALAVVAQPVFRDFGGRTAFAGPAVTVQVRDDNALVRQILGTPGEGRVLVVDGGGSLRCALLGEQLATLALEHGWSGVLVFGCVRDASALAAIPVGIKALATHPARSAKLGAGTRDIALSIAGVSITPGAFVTADADGVVITATAPRQPA